VVRRRLGRTGLSLTPIGFGAFKIGRNVGIKYARGYELPSDDEAANLLAGVLDLGINLIDTAPAYGLSEERIGAAIGHRRDEFVLCTKAGETFHDGRSTDDFSAGAIRRSVRRSLQRLRTTEIDVLLVHSDGRDLEIMRDTDVVETLLDLRDAGLTRAVGFSGKTVEGAREALAWADVLMIPLNLEDQDHLAVLNEAAEADVGVLVKKGLGAGRLDTRAAIRFVLDQPAVTSLVVGGLNLHHLRANVDVATT